MAEHTITVTIRTDAEYETLERRAAKQWRDATQQLSAEVERLLAPKVERKATVQRRGPRSVAA